MASGRVRGVNPEGGGPDKDFSLAPAHRLVPLAHNSVSWHAFHKIESPLRAGTVSCLFLIPSARPGIRDVFSAGRCRGLVLSLRPGEGICPLKAPRKESPLLLGLGQNGKQRLLSQLVGGGGGDDLADSPEVPPWGLLLWQVCLSAC